MRLKLVDRLILSELVVPFLVGTAAVTMMLIGNMLFYYAEPLFAKGVPILAVLQLIVYHTPSLLVLTLPVGTAVAVSLAINRLQRDSELTVIRGTGISLRRVFVPILLVGVLIGAMNLVLSELVVPRAEGAFRRLRDRIYMMQNSPLLRQNVVFRMQNYTFYIGEIYRNDDKVTEVGNVMIIQDGLPYPRTVVAPRADYRDGVWVLHKAVVHIYGEDGTAIDAVAKGLMKINLRVAISDIVSPPAPEETSAMDLRKQAVIAQNSGIDATRLWVSYHFKLAVPFACVVFALCSMPLALKFARAGSFMGVLLAIVLVFVFWNTLLLFKLFGNQGLVPPVVAAWIPNSFFGIIGLWLLAKSD
ncbi:MAG: LptF/LptG family permease [Armatimonadota bacterium]